MKCLDCNNTAKDGARACVECIQKNKDKCVVAIGLSMEALMRSHNLERESGEMTEEMYKSDMKQYHDMRIKRDIYLGLLPEPKEKKRLIRW
jgi:hypothetical protein